MALHQAGDIERAVAIYRQLLETAPSHPQLLFLLGSAQIQMGHAEAAVQHLTETLRLLPGQPRALCNLGVALHSLSRYDEALAAYDGAVGLTPGYATAYNNRGTTLSALGRTDDALISFDRAIALAPNYVEAHNNRGNILRLNGRPEEALAAFDRAQALNPTYVAALVNRGTVLNELARPAEALACFDRAVGLDPNNADAHCGRGPALLNLNRLDEALTSLDRALALQPDHAIAHCNRGNVLHNLMRLDEALEEFNRAIALAPDMADAQTNKGLLKLTRGELAEGFRLYEWRRKTPRGLREDRHFSQPQWTGEPLAGKTLLVHTEQGFGDAVQVCRYLPKIAALGGKVVVEARPRLLPLLASLKGDYAFVAWGTPLPGFDLHCPVMSLPLAFATTLATIPGEVPYLFADPDRRARVAQRLGPAARPRIGLVWSRGKEADDHQRSFSLAALAPLLALPFEFHSLQKDTFPADAAHPLAARLQLHGEEQNDFADAAALIDAMDLVISIDTAVAHIAGAMAKLVWILLPQPADWRFLLDRSDSPWYPTARLFRQRAAGDWDGVIAEVAECLQHHDFTAGRIA